MAKRLVKEKPQNQSQPMIRKITGRNENQKLYLQAIDRNEIVFGIGCAGTGKSLLATYKAVEALLDGSVSKIILTRPAVEAGESIGYLPGDILEKMNPYLRPLYDCLEFFLPKPIVKSYLLNGDIEICPVSYLRGRTFTNCFIISDENQNMTYEQLKLLLTRIGEDSKIVITGDPTQIDIPKHTSGLVLVADKLEHLDCVEVIRFEHEDIQRSRVSKLVVENL